MQSANEHIIYQLTNVGASQQMSPLTPRKADKAPIEQLTPPSSSKSKKWAEKLAKFQRNSAKIRKNSMSPGSLAVAPMPHSLVMTPPHNDEIGNPTTPFSAPGNHTFTSRTSSLPRPTSSLYHHTTSSTPSSMSSGDVTKRLPAPRVIPFGYSKDHVSAKKSFLNEICTICDEPISNRSNGEKIIELECSHIFHQECLLLSIESSVDADSNDLLTLFPSCNSCFNEKGKHNRCIPKDSVLRDKLISGFLLSKRPIDPISPLGSSKSQSFHHGQLGAPASIAGLNQVRKQSLVATTPTNLDFLGDISLASAPAKIHNQKMGSINTKTRSRLSVSNSRLLLRKTARGSSFAASSSIVSSVADFDSLISNDTSRANSTLAVSSEIIPLPISRAFFIKILLRNSFQNITDWEIDDKFGLLRCVDRLVVSKDGNKYTKCWCFLFEHRLVVSLLSQTNESQCNNISETKFASVEIYGPLSGAKVTTVEEYVLKCTIQNNGSDRWHELYLKESMNSNSSEIIQKWISGLLNSELLFNESNFSSNLPSPPMIDYLADCNGGECRSLAGLVSPTKMVELTCMEQAHRSVIIKRGMNIPVECSTRANPTTTINTMMTSISGILSLKRDTPDDLVVVLQLDFEKLRKDKGFATIDNSLKALYLKFPALKLCIVDSSGFIIHTCLMSHKFPSIMHMAANNSEMRFEPEWLKNKYYPDGLIHNVGIAVVSNASMQDTKSCLLLDFKSFTCDGRRRPNELKVRIGYLNADYSDRVNELVELESWDYFLEAISYSFSLYFGDDDDDDDDDNTEGELSTEEKYVSDTEESDIGDNTTLSDTKSPTVAISLSASRDETETNIYGTNSAENSISLSNTPGEKYASKWVDFTNRRSKTIHSRTVDEAWDPLFNDIEQAIKEIEDANPAKSPAKNNDQIFSYNYL